MAASKVGGDVLARRLLARYMHGDVLHLVTVGGGGIAYFVSVNVRWANSDDKNMGKGAAMGIHGGKARIRRKNLFTLVNIGQHSRERGAKIASPNSFVGNTSRVKA